MKEKKLTKYHKKRDFKESPEPYGSTNSHTNAPLFVVQKHASRQTHYDFRLQDNGLLKSWAIPKGPSTDHLKKQLAVETEDHPLEYAQFEGTIPPGEYGAGKVIIWDRGTFKNLKPYPLATALSKGEAVIELHGTKLKGKYALIRTHYLGKRSWLFIKMKDRYERPGYSIIQDQPASIVTGKTIEELET
jgi:DNA ligase D-like protein (predicted 3'-phosphoesterase)